jgi:hypothetical protein
MRGIHTVTGSKKALTILKTLENPHGALIKSSNSIVSLKAFRVMAGPQTESSESLRVVVLGDGRGRLDVAVDRIDAGDTNSLEVHDSYTEN